MCNSSLQPLFVCDIIDIAMMFKNHIDAKTFTEQVESLVQDKGLDLFEAIFYVAEKNNIGEERIPSLIVGQLKNKLRAHGENKNMLKRNGRLPI